jgi:hypothetical protein
VIVARVSDDPALYPVAPPLDEEFGWLADPARRYRGRERPRGVGPDRPAREYLLRRAAALDRAALRTPTPEAVRAAERAAEALWVEDGWDENWEGVPPRAYVRFTYARWQDASVPDPR